jgi:electron transport complex protein RnfG
MDKQTFNRYVVPVIVLFVICLVVSTGLAATFSITNPVIVENTKKLEDETRQVLLPDADSFTEYDGKLLKSDDGKVAVTAVFVADNGEGMVMNIETKSFGGTLTEMVGIDKTGAITGVKVTNSSDTPGVGTKAAEPSFLDQYKGLPELSDPTAKKDTNVNAVSGATVSSNAIHYGVYQSLEQFKQMGGVK